MSEYQNTETQVLSLIDLGIVKKNTGLYFVLTIIEGNDFGAIFNLEKEKTIIGRKDTVGDKPDIELDDDRVSRQHLSLLKKKLPDNTFSVSIVDLNSKNGSFVNNQRLTSVAVELQHNDKIQIGNTVIKVEIKETLDTAQYQERLYQQITRDPLTNLWNYNYAKKEAERILSISNKQKLVFSVAILEIDFFQLLNETHGVNIGDTIFRAVAQRIQIQLREYDILARYPENKFLLILPDTDIHAAFNIIDALRKLIESFDFSQLEYSQRVTVSGGVAQFPISGQKINKLIEQADEALFRAKQIGRNRIEKADALEQKSINIKSILVRSIALVLIVIALGTILYKLYPIVFYKAEAKIIFSGTVETHSILVGSKVGGRVSDVLISEGDLVKKDQVLVVFDVSELLAQRDLLEARIEQKEANLVKLLSGFRQEEIAQANANLQEAKVILERLKNGPRKQEIEEVKALLVAAQADFLNTELTFKRIDEVYKNGYFPRQSRDDAENRLNLAKANVEALKQRLSTLEEGTRKEEIRAAEERVKQAEAAANLFRTGSRNEDILQAKAEVKSAKAELANINISIAESKVFAPSDSYVQTIRVRPGDILQPGRPVAELLEKDQMWVKVYVPETQMAYVHINQPVSILIDAFPKRTFVGVIRQISEKAEFYPRNVQSRTDREHQVFGMKVYLDNKESIFKSGMSADVYIDSKE